MRVLVTGAGGMLGTDVCADLENRGHTVIATGRKAHLFPLDVTDSVQVAKVFRETLPDVVVHCAAWTNVDGAERDTDGAWRGNTLANWNVAVAASEIEAWVIAVSTDFVFDGAKNGAYDEFDAVNPLGVYGKSKAAGEQLMRQILPNRSMIVRTSWLYGEQGKSFPATILRLAKKLPEVPVVSDEIGSPTYTKSLSRKICELIDAPMAGTYHVCDDGVCSRFEMAQTVVKLAGLETPIVPITAAEYGTRFNSTTKRPANSALRRLALELRSMDDLPPWKTTLATFIANALTAETPVP